MAAKKLVSMRISDNIDEKLSSLAEELGESKSNMISAAVNAYYEKQQEEKRLQEEQVLFQNFICRHFNALFKYPRERKLAIRLVEELRYGVNAFIISPFENTFYPEYENIPDAIYIPFKETMDEFLSIIKTQLELHDSQSDP